MDSIDLSRRRLVQGLAIGFWNLEATAYASDGGQYALRTNAAYDLYLA